MSGLHRRFSAVLRRLAIQFQRKFTLKMRLSPAGKHKCEVL